MTDPILDLIESTATDPAADQTLRDWILESVVPVLCAEVRAARTGKAPALPPTLTALATPAPAAPRAPKPARAPKREKTGGKRSGPKVPGLKAAMKKAGMLAPELAGRLGVSTASISNWKSGRTSCPRTQSLASVLGCTVEELTQ